MPLVFRRGFITQLFTVLTIGLLEQRTLPHLTLFRRPARTRGTPRAYFQHHVADDILANVGEQDLTAHVNFSAILKTGEEAGLITEYFGTQAKFLTEILATAGQSHSFGGWSANQTRQFQTLTHPEHLGRAFRVLVQSR